MLWSVHSTEDDRRRVGHAIKAARIRAGLTQIEVGDRLGLPRPGLRVSQWETGRRLPPRALWPALSDYLDVDVASLLFGVAAGGDDWQAGYNAGYLQAKADMLAAVRKLAP